MTLKHQNSKQKRTKKKEQQKTKKRQQEEQEEEFKLTRRQVKNRKMTNCQEDATSTFKCHDMYSSHV